MGEWLPSVAGAIDGWLSDLELAGNPAGTRRVYRSLLTPLLSGESVTSLTPAICREFVAHRVRTQSLKTAATAYGALSSFLKYGVSQHWWAVSPLAGVPCPQPRQKAQRTLSRDELRGIWAACATDESKALILFLTLGLRAQELVSLRWQDIGADGTVRVLFTKGSRPRSVAANDMLLAVLERLPHAGPRIFGFTTQGLRNRLVTLGLRAGVPGVHPHLFRHTWAVNWLLETNDAATLQTLGGWAGEAMVRHYARSALQESAIRKARAVDLSAKLLGDESEGRRSTE